MALRNLTKVPKLCLVYFSSDKTTSIVETKKLRDKETQNQFTDLQPPKFTTVTLRHSGKVLEAMVIASHDDVANLNDQEKLFVEDPENAHLFDVEVEQSGTKRTTEGSSMTSLAKKKKTDDAAKDEVQLLAEFLQQQNQKQAELKRKRSQNQHVETGEAGVQCGSGVVSRHTADASVQTDHYDATIELRQQIQHLTKVVKQLTELKCLHQNEPPASPLFDDESDLPTLDPAAVATVMDFCNSPPVQPTREAASSGPTDSHCAFKSPLSQNHGQDTSPVYPLQVAPLRQPLLTLDQNVIPRVSNSHGPTDEQRSKVTAIVDYGHDMSTAALACVDVLFTDDEMAQCNTSGTRGFQQLDNSKLSFLLSVLQRKFNSPCFSEQWNQIVHRINTKCRGKRRTLIHRLKKKSLFC